MLIGVIGFAGSGKGTISDILCQDHDFIKLAFADSVKDATAVVFGWPRHLLEGDTDESRNFREKTDDFWSARLGRNVTPRWALQIMGTEAGRNTFHESIWIYATEAKMNKIKNVVLADVRFPNEIKFIRDKGGFIVRVVRGDDPEWYSTAYDHMKNDKYDMHIKYPNVHVSEWAWIGTDFDYVIYNNGPKSELEANIKYMLKTFTGPRTSAIM